MKRAAGEGSVFRLKDGTWRAACRLGKPSFRGATRAEALRKRDAYLRTHHQFLALPKRARDSYASLLQRWLDSRRDSLRPRTVESYYETIERYIIPTIGLVSFGALTADHISQAMAKAKSPRTKNYIRLVCHLALKFAVERGELSVNVATLVPSVRQRHVEREMPTDEQWTALKAAIARENVGTRALLLTIAFCGLRVGEAIGLRWSDFHGSHFSVQRAASRSHELAPVKTKAGKRLVPLSELAIAALNEWRSEQKRLREKHAKRWKRAHVPDLVFTSRYGTPWSDRNVLRAVHRVTEKAGLGKKSTHYLRHVAISHLISDPEMDIKSVQMIAGHSSVQVTLDTYGHLMPGWLQKAKAAMDRKG